MFSRLDKFGLGRVWPVYFCLPACLPAVVDLKIAKGTFRLFFQDFPTPSSLRRLFLWESSARSMNAAPPLPICPDWIFPQQPWSLLLWSRLPMRRGQVPQPPDLALGESSSSTFEHGSSPLCTCTSSESRRDRQAEKVSRLRNLVLLGS